MQQKKVPIIIEDENHLPLYGTEHAAGADIRAANRQDIVLEPGCSALIPTGIRLEIPEGYEIQIRPRSGLAAKNQITILNAPGTIDADFRGEIHIILINHGKHSFTVTYGMRIAQIILAPVVKADFILVEALQTSARGEGGFGHTGTL